MNQTQNLTLHVGMCEWMHTHRSPFQYVAQHIRHIDQTAALGVHSHRLPCLIHVVLGHIHQDS